jgi:hypothetical protein
MRCVLIGTLPKRDEFDKTKKFGRILTRILIKITKEYPLKAGEEIREVPSRPLSCVEI